MSDNLTVRKRMEILRRLLGESGYKIFDIDPELQNTDMDFIAIHGNKPTSPIWLYPSKKGRIVMRPWAGDHHSRLLKDKLPEHYARSLGLMRSRAMPLGHEWHEWLSPSSREEARSLGFPL